MYYHGSPFPVRVKQEVYIPDVMQALLEQERMGTLMICRYGELSQRMLDWIFRAELEEIRKRNLLHTLGPMADYMRQHYPAVWKAAQEKEKNPEG